MMSMMYENIRKTMKVPGGASKTVVMPSARFVERTSSYLNVDPLYT
jgi:hypothetical protein